MRPGGTANRQDASLIDAHALFQKHQYIVLPFSVVLFLH